MKEIFKRYLVFVIGLYFLAAGIVLIIRSALGTTPISSINYVLSLNSPLSLGTCTFIINMVLPANYGMSIALLLTGCMVQSIGVVLELKPKVAMMSAEAFVKYASRHYNKEFGKFKVYFDITLVTLAVILSLLLNQGIQGVREGSLIAACITGYIVSFLNQKIMTRKTLHRLLPVWK